MYVLVFVLFLAAGVGLAQSYEKLARVSTVSLHGTEILSIEPLSRIGVILLAIEDCTIRVNGLSVDLKTGERKFVHGVEIVKVSSSGSRPTPLVIVNVKRAQQAQTFDHVELGLGKIMEDASDRNETLLVALNSLRLHDLIDRADEGEPSNYGKPHVIELGAGQTAWLQPGIHQIINVGGSMARFVTIEW
jgi:hypothetical protein